jgi:hypothetical protein
MEFAREGNMLPRPARVPQRQRQKSSWLRASGLLVPFLASANAQEIGVGICSCAPSTYEFTLDFSLFCPPINITTGDAVLAINCLVSPPFGDPTVVDLIPTEVQSIDVFEQDQNLRIFNQENIVGSFGDGDTFRYTSIAALPGEIIERDLPRAIQLNIMGVNQFDEPITNFFIISFTNSCGGFPVLFEGQSAGWTRFVSA